MFSSNQELTISGSLYNERDLKSSLDFALKLDGIDITDGTMIFQITNDGKYCIGQCWNEIPDGWKVYPFDFDTDIVSRIIRQFLEKAPVEEGIFDGSYKKGFLMKVIPDVWDSFGNIKNPFDGIVYFEPFTCFYSK